MKNYWVFFEDDYKMVLSGDSIEDIKNQFFTILGIADIQEVTETDLIIF